MSQPTFHYIGTHHDFTYEIVTFLTHYTSKLIDVQLTN